MAARHDKQQTFGAVAEDQAEASSHPDFIIIARELADAKSEVTVRVAEVLLQLPQCAADFAAHIPGIIPHLHTKRLI